MAIKEIKKFVAFPGLMPLQPDAYGHPCTQACQTEPPHPSGLPLADGKPQSKIAAVGNTKRLPWSRNDYPRLVRGSALHPLAYCPPGRVSSVGLSWHTSSVGVPGYSWYCPPGSRDMGGICPMWMGSVGYLQKSQQNLLRSDGLWHA